MMMLGETVGAVGPAVGAAETVGGAVDRNEGAAVGRTVGGGAVGAAVGAMNICLDVPWPDATHVTSFSWEPSTAVATPAAPPGEMSLFTDKVNFRVDAKLFFSALNWSAVRGNLACTVLETP